MSIFMFTRDTQVALTFPMSKCKHNVGLFIENMLHILGLYHFKILRWLSLSPVKV